MWYNAYTDLSLTKKQITETATSSGRKGLLYMGYTIIYSRQFIKTSDGRIIPLALAGSSNCYESSLDSRGRERWRRDRNWTVFNYISNKDNTVIAFTPEEIIEWASEIPDDKDSYCKRNGKWMKGKDDKSFFLNGIKDAKTIEELNELSRYPITLNGYLSVWYTDGSSYSDGSPQSRNRTENRCRIKSSQELDEFLTNAETRVNSKADNESSMYVCVEFPGDKAIEYPNEKRLRKAKERLTGEHFVIKADNEYSTWYIQKLNPRSIKGTHNILYAKQFATEKEAEKWMDEKNINFRFKSKFTIEKVGPAKEAA
jgi:hypothetical protein